MPTQMTRLIDFQNRSSLILYLAKQLKAGRVAIMLGSGVSKPFGLPTWEELLLKLFAKRGDTPTSGLDVKRQASEIRLKYFQNDKPGFLAETKATLYEGVSIDFDQLRKSKTLSAIGALVMASHRGNAAKVITLNWDNLLELYLAYHGFQTLSAIEEVHWAGNVDVTILHPHGYLPYGSTGTNSADIIFDQSSYSAVVGQDQRPWRQEILSILRSHTILFIGLSGRDDNLDSLLQIANEQHASKEEQSLFWGVTLDVRTNDFDQRSWQNNGVYYLELSDFDNDLPDVLFRICQEASKL